MQQPAEECRIRRARQMDRLLQAAVHLEPAAVRAVDVRLRDRLAKPVGGPLGRLHVLGIAAGRQDGWPAGRRAPWLGRGETGGEAAEQQVRDGRPVHQPRAHVERLELRAQRIDEGEVERCFRMTRHRLDCVVTSGFDEPETAWVRAVALNGQRLQFGFYRARLRRRYTRSNTIRSSPPGFRLQRISVEYRRSDATYRPRRLLRINLGLGYGRPRRRSIIRRQCDVQPRLPCRRTAR
ncbi:MAG: hypothetical protein ACRDPC_20690 [Solirubrobacteraceae bacterium]